MGSFFCLILFCLFIFSFFFNLFFSFPPTRSWPRSGAGCAGEALCHGAAAEPSAFGKNITLKKIEKKKKVSRYLNTGVLLNSGGGFFLAAVAVYLFFGGKNELSPPPPPRSPLIAASRAGARNGSSTQAGDNKTKGDFVWLLLT